MVGAQAIIRCTNLYGKEEGVEHAASIFRIIQERNSK
jgi:hypothetical protein